MDENLKKAVLAEIERYSREIIEIARQIESAPEPGFCEEKTSALAAEVLTGLGLSCKTGLALTGVRALASGRTHNANVCVLGEMDAVMCGRSPIAAQNGYAHVCGHNAQMAAMLGAAFGLLRSGVFAELDGDATFFAVPAEEYIDIAYRRSLVEAGKLRYMSGKQELIANGAFKDIDMAMMVHAEGCCPQSKFFTRGKNLGFAARAVKFKGKAAHASEPQYGVNALNAASLAILGIHANRETFTENEHIRIHPIITKGGDMVNVVPDEIDMELYVRGATPEAIKKGCLAVDRAVTGACQIIGAEAETEDLGGYKPLLQSQALSELFEKSAELAFPGVPITRGKPITGSSDIGDLSRLIPCIQPTCGGFDGALHSETFRTADYYAACVLPAKVMALTVCALLSDGAAGALAVRSGYENGK